MGRRGAPQVLQVGESHRTTWQEGAGKIGGQGIALAQRFLLIHVGNTDGQSVSRKTFPSLEMGTATFPHIWQGLGGFMLER